MSRIKTICILIILLFTNRIIGQDVPRAAYDEEDTTMLTADNLQFFAQFEATAGDVVYLQAAYTEYSSANIEVDLRDSVGRTIGFREEYIFQMFVIAEIPSDGLYTIVITGEEPGEIKYLLGLSGYLDDGIESTINPESFRAIFLLRVEDSGDYTLSYQRTDGEMGTDFTIMNFSESIPKSIIGVDGTSSDEWNATFELDDGDTYIAFLDRNFWADRGTEATVQIQLTSASD